MKIDVLHSTRPFWNFFVDYKNFCGVKKCDGVLNSCSISLYNGWVDRNIYGILTSLYCRSKIKREMEEYSKAQVNLKKKKIIIEIQLPLCVFPFAIPPSSVDEYEVFRFTLLIITEMIILQREVILQGNLKEEEDA